MLTLEALIDESGNIRLVQPVSIPSGRRALLIILDEAIPAVSETALLSESALSEDWQRPEEDEAWSYLQRATS
ncbi:MAG: hypothetical protein H7Y59_18675 [Anaerolineales bacterium]|nr:hypothetical protein [Anaerolineales bacterium]